MSEPNKDRMGNFVLSSFGLGILALFLGSILKLQTLLFIGILALIPLCLVLVFAAVATAWETANEIIPNFRGKNLLVGLITLVITLMFIAVIFGGSGSDLSDCPTYRGVPTC